MHKFILITTDSESLNGEKFSAQKVAESRLKNNLWPLYKGTSNKNIIQSGQKCLFYLAGQYENSQSIVAMATIDKVRGYMPKIDILDCGLLVKKPDKVIVFSKINLFSRPIYIRPLLTKLALFRNKKRWGVMLMGGCRAITDQDYTIIMKSKES